LEVSEQEYLEDWEQVLAQNYVERR
jgi:hypothetical protein